MRKRVQNNQFNDGIQDGNGIPHVVWILPSMMIGAMFGSLVGARTDHTFGQLAPLGLAPIGVVDMLLVAAVGLRAARSEQSG